MQVNDFLSKEEIQDFCRASDLRGFQALVVTYLMMAGSFVLVAKYPTWWAILLALIILGGRHLALSILTHDCAHNSLFKTQWLNPIVGKWFCGNLTWLPLDRYRELHLRHHQFAGSKEDPDLELVAVFPVTRGSMLRKFIRDISGFAGLRRSLGLFLMDFGYIEFTVSSAVKRIDQKGRSLVHLLMMGLGNIHGLLISNTILFFILFAFEVPWLYLLWIVSYLTTFSLILRMRSIAEHACTEMGLDPLKNTRTTMASIFARLTVAPHRVNYHLEHHILMTVPYYKLPKLHQVLKERGCYKDAFLANSYWEILKEASAYPEPAK